MVPAAAAAAASIIKCTRANIPNDPEGQITEGGKGRKISAMSRPIRLKMADFISTPQRYGEESSGKLNCG